jgi:hypothetical protein
MINNVEFSPPELGGANYTNKVDVYSVGLISKILLFNNIQVY